MIMQWFKKHIMCDHVPHTVTKIGKDKNGSPFVKRQTRCLTCKRAMQSTTLDGQQIATLLREAETKQPGECVEVDNN